MTCIVAVAQTEVGGQTFSGNDTGSGLPALEPSLAFDSLSLRPPILGQSRVWRCNATRLPDIGKPDLNSVKGFSEQSSQGGTALRLWNGAYIGFLGENYHLPGLMNISAGTVALHQDLGRWHFTASTVANKYWMPWQRTLSTQYGFGGTVGYDLSEVVSLHAFGYYYGNQMQVGPSMSPYVHNTTYGGYADIRFSKLFGSNLGVRRYVNPMNGKWTTEPIVNPYIQVGSGKIELPLGGILKNLIWGEQDNPMRYRPHPMSVPSGKNGRQR